MERKERQCWSKQSRVPIPVKATLKVSCYPTQSMIAWDGVEDPDTGANQADGGSSSTESSWSFP